MKEKLMIIMTVLYFGMGLNCMADGKPETTTSTPIDFILRNNSGTTYRSLVPSPHAYYYSKENMIELDCLYLGEVDVYIINSDGNVVAEDSFNSEFVTTFTIDTPETPGVYWIILNSTIMYAEGSFSIY